MIIRKYHILNFLQLAIVFAFVGCVSTGKVRTQKLETNLGPYLYHYNGIQSRLYGDINTAINLQNKSIQLDPSNSAPYYELALCYGVLSDNPKAVTNLEKALTIEPDNKFYRYYLVILYINLNDISNALKNQEYLVKLDSLNFNYRLSLALLNSDAGNYAEAYRLLEAISKDFGYNPQVSDAKIKILFEQNRTEELETEINQLITNQPEVALYRMYESEFFFRKGEDSLGFLALEQAQQLDPDNGYVKINKYLRLKDYGKSFEAYRLLNEIFIDTNINVKDKSDLFFPLLFDPSSYGKFSGTVDTLVNTIKLLYPEDIKIQEYFFEHCINKKDFVTARKTLTKILELDIENPKIWERVVTFDFTFGNPESAIVYAQRASRKFPELSIFYILKAISLDTINETQLAIETLIEGTQKVKNDNTGKAEIFGTIADFYYKLNNFKQAFDSYEDGLKLDPHNTRILNNYSYYLSLRKQNLNKALEMSSLAVDLEPNNSTYIDTKGWVLFQMERYEEARDVLRNAISKSGSTSAVITEHYADALFKTGNKDNALIYWIKAKELGGNSEKLLIKIETKSYIP